DDGANVALVDAHSKGRGGDYPIEAVFGPLVDDATPIGIGCLAMKAVDPGKALAAQQFHPSLRVAALGHVEDEWSRRVAQEFEDFPILLGGIILAVHPVLGLWSEMDRGDH